MGENPLSLLALACSIAALASSLVVLIRSTPQKVRKTANDAMQMAEDSQNAVQLIANRFVTLMEEVTRERAAAASDLEEAERKRRQAAAKNSRVNAAEAANAAPQSLKELLATLPVGHPDRIKVLRQAKTAAGEGL